MNRSVILLVRQLQLLPLELFAPAYHTDTNTIKGIALQSFSNNIFVDAKSIHDLIIADENSLDQAFKANFRKNLSTVQDHELFLIVDTSISKINEKISQICTLFNCQIHPPIVEENIISGFGSHQLLTQLSSKYKSRRPYQVFMKRLFEKLVFDIELEAKLELIHQFYHDTADLPEPETKNRIIKEKTEIIRNFPIISTIAKHRSSKERKEIYLDLHAVLFPRS